ncbi:MAG: 5-methylcytosine-specific restriction enzyme subunit McrC [Mucilaginibacter sp.]|nr:5-methylcytosine-specific restriction enzyme subunit McrC [Mucilaginibacter sp.]
MLNIRQYDYWEHASGRFKKTDFPEGQLIQSKKFGLNPNRLCYEITNGQDDFNLEIGYYIGVDWLVENHSSIIIAPKLNSRIGAIRQEVNLNSEIELDSAISTDRLIGKEVSIDYFAMLNQCLASEYLYREIDDLVHINWATAEVPINQSQDWLSPLIIVKFLNVLKIIVRKGLKKSYYQTSQNLNSKIKGKILVGQNIKQNIAKNKLTHTICQYEDFGIDSLENRLLKKAFQFAITYLENYKKAFPSGNNHFNNVINFCRPAFEHIGNEVNIFEVKNHKANPFFKEYNEAIHLAKLLLRRFAYSLSNTAKEQITTPPYWIDMPKLFELYVYHFLKCRFSNSSKEVHYHLSTYGNELDFLINTNNTKMVVDAKYKPLYIYGINHQDIRQVSGYARLEKIYGHLDIKENELIDCLIIYPDVQNGYTEKDFSQADLKNKPIRGYRNIYKIGINIPIK